MNPDREKKIEVAVLMFVGLLAFAAILAFLPEANAQGISQIAKSGTATATTASVTSTENSVRTQ